MQAFEDCKVSKDEVLGSLKMHQAADRFIRGKYWKDGKGCSMGCTIHDFAPGEEKNHFIYPKLFGLPVSFAYLQDGIFEGLPLEESKEWSVKVISAIPEGCDVGRKIDEFLYWILSGEDSPISKYRDKKEIKAVAELYRRKLDGESVKVEEWEKAEKAADYASDYLYIDADEAAYAAAIYATLVTTYAYAVHAVTSAADVGSDAASYGIALKKVSGKFINILKGE